MDESDEVESRDDDEPDTRDEQETSDQDVEEQPRREMADESPAQQEEQRAELEDSEYRDPSEMFVEDGEARDDEPDAEALFGGDVATAEEVLGDEAEQPEGSTRQGRQLLSSWRENEEAMKASLENFVPHIQPGNHTSVNARASEHASYIARMHRSIHARWAERFIPRVSRNFSSSHELNDRSLQAVVEIVIDAEQEEVVETVRAQPSGNDLFDAEALNIARDIDDVSDPPDSIVSPDGKIYIHWSFWRDKRRCGTFGVRIFELEEGADTGSDDDL